MLSKFVILLLLVGVSLGSEWKLRRHRGAPLIPGLYPLLGNEYDPLSSLQRLPLTGGVGSCCSTAGYPTDLHSSALFPSIPCLDRLRRKRLHYDNMLIEPTARPLGKLYDSPHIGVCPAPPLATPPTISFGPTDPYSTATHHTYY
ncbi:hypothetical protein O3M35_010176 [Rhynocoris fuscipes]|uniref:Uncharacterized protein n=1 Tax=Rhynocoris fuscipes TaxID=488301 RepID=A0AAW1CXX5_9HEMI